MFGRTDDAAPGEGGEHEVLAAVRELSSLVIVACDADALAVAAARVRRVRGFLDATDAALARRADELHRQGASAPADEVMARHGGVSSKGAKRTTRRAAALGNAPAMSNALSKGEISGDHADAMASAASRLTDEQRDRFFEHDEALAERAAECSPERFEAHCKNLAASLTADEGEEKADHDRRETKLRKFVDPRTGRYVINGEFDDEFGATVFAALDAEVRALLYSKQTPVGVAPGLEHDHEHLAAIALVNLLRGGRSRVAGNVEVQVIIDLETLMNGIHEHTVCETGAGRPFPVASARRLACEAAIIPTVLGSTGEVLDQGRAERQPNRAQRRALRAMYGTCAFADCQVAFHECQIHHIRPWEANGPTDLLNLVPLCWRHHHRVHEGGWSVELLPGRVLRIVRADGVHHADVPLDGASASGDGRRERPPERPPQRTAA